MAGCIMATLPIFNTNNTDLMLMQNKWASQLNPLLRNPLSQGLLITGVSLSANTPLAINHLLDRMQQGWLLTDINTSAKVWRTQPLNNKTLTLEADANTTISLLVY